MNFSAFLLFSLSLSFYSFFVILLFVPTMMMNIKLVKQYPQHGEDIHDLLSLKIGRK